MAHHTFTSTLLLHFAFTLLSINAHPLPAPLHHNSLLDPLESSGSAPIYTYYPSSYNPQHEPSMIHYDKFNLIMPDYYDNHPAASMQYQNFEKFYDPLMPLNMEMKMDESQQFIQQTPVRAPQPLTAEEKRIRQKLLVVDERKEKKAIRSLKKGTTKPKGAAYPQWDQFDYDLYTKKADGSKKSSQG